MPNPTISRMEENAIAKLEKEFFSSVKSSLYCNIENHLGYINTRDRDSLIEVTARHFTDQLKANIRERALTTVTANLTQLFELMTECVDKQEEALSGT